MEWIETNGKTVADAVEMALDRLGVHEDDLEYEVVQEPRSGLLGRKEARIRARVRPISREKPGGDRRRRGGKRNGAGGSRGAGRGGRSGRGPARGSEPERAGAPDGERAAASGTGSGAAPGGAGDGGRSGSGRSRRRRGGRGGGAARAAADSTGSGERPPSGRDKERAVSESTVPVQEQADSAAAFTRGLVAAFGYDATVTTREEAEDVVIVDVEGTGLGLLVGPKGATLQAIEELVRTAMQRQTEGHGVRLHVDVGGYRARRREALEEFARKLAEEVKASGTEKALEPMSAADRKAVHDACAEVEGVSTTSEGEDPRRRVVILPA
ncbi:MAG: RNA-binding cell elongation regulator Jag/EloR [Acidimicrobiia bacterium]